MAFIDEMLTGITRSPNIFYGRTMQGGMTIPNNQGYGGVRCGSYASIQEAMSQFSNQTFTNGWNCVVPWVWSCAASGHNAPNTCLEMRRLCVQMRKSDGTWHWLFREAWPGFGIRKIRDEWDTASSGLEQQIGDIIRVFPSGNYTWEYWPENTPGAPIALETFFGGVNRTLCTETTAICVAVQVRLSLINAQGTDDRANSRIAVQVGTDPHARYVSGKRYINNSGYQTDTVGENGAYPYKAYDGDYSCWRHVSWNNWQWVGFVTCDGAPNQQDANSSPPWSNYSSTPHWFKAPYQITYSQLLANPPLDPDLDSPSPAPTPPPAPGPSPAPSPNPPSEGENLDFQAAHWVTIEGEPAWYAPEAPAPGPIPAPAPTPTPTPSPTPVPSGPNPKRPITTLKVPKIYTKMEK